MYVLEVPYISLDQIYNSTQMLTWTKLRDGKYVISHGNKVLKVQQQKQRLIMSCSEDDFCNVWFHYFGLSVDYQQINYRIRRESDVMLRAWANRCRGLRIVQQTPFEALLSAGLLSISKSYNLAKAKFQVINETFGIKHVQSMREAGRVRWFEFPTAETILSRKEELEKCFLTYKEIDFVVAACSSVADGKLNLEELKDQDYDTIIEELVAQDYMTKKMAQYICQFGYGLWNDDFVLYGVASVIDKDFDLDYATFADWYFANIKGQHCIGQQYILYNKKNPPKEGSEVIWD